LLSRCIEALELYLDSFKATEDCFEQIEEIQ